MAAPPSAAVPKSSRSCKHQDVFGDCNVASRDIVVTPAASIEAMAAGENVAPRWLV
jgi:hypothetical protein